MADAISFHPACGAVEGTLRKMPRYDSHKTVAALEIKSVDDYGRLAFVEPGYAPIMTGAEMFARYKPVAGDFYVVYADGYQSFSPRKAFLEGYTKAKED